jgi:lipoprotein-anchoring transpeptidase ErfK/SrfK
MKNPTFPSRRRFGNPPVFAKKTPAMNTARLALTALTLLVFSACQMPTSFVRREVVRRAILVQPADSSSSPLFVWHGSGQSGSIYVTIDLSQQKAYVFRNSQNIGWSYVASGRSGHSTPTGTFRISEKIVDKRSNLYGSIVDSRGNIVRSDATAGVHRVPSGCRFVGAQMPYWMRLTGGGVGMHSGFIPNPGFPASHGCIRLPYEMAARIYSVAPPGTPVTIVP